MPVKSPMQSPRQWPEVMDSEQTAEYLAISSRTLLQLIKEEKGPPHQRVGRQFRFNREALDEWLSQKGGE